MAYYTTEPADRQEFIASLRALADHLAAHPAIPVPIDGGTILMHADSTECGGNLEVEHVAALLGAEVFDDTATGGHYLAVRSFGVLGYEIVSIPETCRAQYAADRSYQGCVKPDQPAQPAIGA
jgi:hypothetical protein